MGNTIAVIWDCDKTLIDGYMQDPIFEKYHINPSVFWAEVNAIPEKYKEKGVRVNKDTYYLNHFIHCAHNGIMPGLNNDMLREFGSAQKFYAGIPEFFEKTKNMLIDDKQYSEYGIHVEHYIVSTGFAEVIRGSVLAPYVEGIWGCELIENQDSEGNNVISEIAYSIDNTTKTRAIFEINKGIPQMPTIDVNAKIPKDLRRVRFENMIYIADGPSDVPAFSLVKQKGGTTFAIYPKGNMKALRQVEQLRIDDRVDMYAEADYSENTTANMWITNKIYEIANRIRNEEKSKITHALTEVPTHIIE